MRSSDRRAVYYVLILILALIATALVPASLVTQQWLVMQLAEVVDVNSGTLVVSGRVEKTYGLFQFCSFSGAGDTCDAYDFSATVPEFVFPANCDRSQSELKTRLQVASVFSILALVGLFFVVILLIMLIIGSRRHRPGLLAGSHIFVKDNHTAVLTVIFTTLFSTVCQLVTVAVYGGTIGSWANCGDHYCDAGAIAFGSTPLSYPGLQVRQSGTYNCGYGYSFAFAIIALLMAFFALVLQLIDFATLPRVHSSPEQHALVSERSHHQPTPAQQGANIPRSAHAEETREEHFNSEVVLTQVHTVSESHAGGQEAETTSTAAVTTPINRTHESPMTRHFTTGLRAPPVADTPSPRRHQVLLPEGDDWEFDPQENLYWSPSMQLFFDHSSGHFYDPESGSWYNPQLAMWYRL